MEFYPSSNPIQTQSPASMMPMPTLAVPTPMHATPKPFPQIPSLSSVMGPQIPSMPSTRSFFTAPNNQCAFSQPLRKPSPVKLVFPLQQAKTMPIQAPLPPVSHLTQPQPQPQPPQQPSMPLMSRGINVQNLVAQPVPPQQHADQEAAAKKKRTTKQRSRNHPICCGNEKCRTTETPLWRKGWTDSEGRSVMLCNACGLHYKKGHYCPHCNQIYKESDADDLTNPWVGCDRCSRWVHQGCDIAHGGVAPKPGMPYLCPTCQDLKANNRFLFESDVSVAKKRRKKPKTNKTLDASAVAGTKGKIKIASKSNNDNNNNNNSNSNSNSNSNGLTTVPQQTQFDNRRRVSAFVAATSENLSRAATVSVSPSPKTPTHEKPSINNLLSPINEGNPFSQQHPLPSLGMIVGRSRSASNSSASSFEDDEVVSNSSSSSEDASSPTSHRSAFRMPPFAVVPTGKESQRQQPQPASPQKMFLFHKDAPVISSNEHLVKQLVQRISNNTTPVQRSNSISDLVNPNNNNNTGAEMPLSPSSPTTTTTTTTTVPSVSSRFSISHITQIANKQKPEESHEALSNMVFKPLKKRPAMLISTNDDDGVPDTTRTKKERTGGPHFEVPDRLAQLWAVCEAELKKQR